LNAIKTHFTLTGNLKVNIFECN